MNYSTKKHSPKNKIGLIDIIIALSLINILYLNLKIVWFGTTGETWFAVEPSTLLMPLITVYALFHMINNLRIISTKLGVSIVCYLSYAVIITIFNFNFSLYDFIFAFVSVIYWGCTVYLFYVYTLQNGFSNKIFKFAVFWFILLCAIFLYRYSFYKTDGGFEGKTLLLNNVYYILFLLPFMLLTEKKIWQYLSFGLTFIIAVLSQKRGALIIIVLCAIIWFMSSKQGSVFSSKVKNVIIMSIIGIIVYYLLSYFTESYDLSVTDRLITLINGEDTTGSGRNNIWQKYFSVMKEDGILSIIGRGYDANVVSPKYRYLTWAHNDFLQIMFDYGYFGAFLFLTFVVNIFKKWKRMESKDYEYDLVFLISLIIVFMNGLFSMCFVYPQWILTAAALWGILIGDFNRKLNQR